jgi:hypothetical protein
VPNFDGLGGYLCVNGFCVVKSFIFTHQNAHPRPQTSDYCPRQTKETYTVDLVLVGEEKDTIVRPTLMFWVVINV